MITQNLHKTTGRVYTTQKVCVVCNAKSKCAISNDGQKCLCWNEPSNQLHPGNGSYVHWLTDSREWLPSDNIAPRAIAEPKQKARPERLAPFNVWADLSLKQTDALSLWAARRSVPVATLHAIGCLKSNSDLLIPERLATAPFEICGHAKRFASPYIDENGSKRRFTFKGKRGWTFAEPIKNQPYIAILVVEGFADSASANAAGFYGVARSTRNADLTPLKLLLSSLDESIRIFVVCENDEPKPGRKTPWQEVSDRAKQLSDALGRSVLVASPPPEHKDINDWWVGETKYQGHLMPEAERHAIGRKMLDYMLQSASESIIAANVAKANFIAEDIELNALLDRIERRPYEVDLDYDVRGSCSFKKVLTKASNNSPDIKILGVNLACKSWKCSACRQRIIIPTAKIALLKAFAGETEMFVSRVPREKLKACRKDLNRKKALWAIVSDRQMIEVDDEGLVVTEPLIGPLVFSNRPILGLCSHYDLLAQSKFDAFATYLTSTIGVADPKFKQPITTCRRISVNQKPDRNDWFIKIQKILKDEPELYIDLVAKETASAIRAEAFQSKRKFGIKKFDCLTIDLPGCPSLLIATKNFIGGNKSRELAKAVLRRFVFDPSSILKATSRWRPKKNKGWTLTPVKAGPEEVREYARLNSHKVNNIDFGTLAAIQDAAQIHVAPTELAPALKKMGELRHA